MWRCRCRQMVLLKIHACYVKVLLENSVGRSVLRQHGYLPCNVPHREESDIVDAAEKPRFMKCCWIDAAVSVYLAHGFTQVSVHFRRKWNNKERLSAKIRLDRETKLIANDEKFHASLSCKNLASESFPAYIRKKKKIDCENKMIHRFRINLSRGILFLKWILHAYIITDISCIVIIYSEC